MIVFDNVTKRYPLGNSALQEASFEIKDHEYVFLVGASGAGKTTILKLLMREMLPTEGTVQINDFEVSSPQFKTIETLRRSIGMIFQDFKVLPDKNVFENIAVSLKIMGATKSRIKDDLSEALSLVGLSEKSLMFPAQLSAGELQRVAIARAIVGDRDIILADEPTGNLDPKTTWEIMKIFKKLEGKKTIIIATHNTDVVNSLKKRVIILEQGKIVKDIKKGGYDL